MEFETIKWPGVGGRDYEFRVHALPCERYGRGERGVCVFAREAGAAWRAIRIDHGFIADLIRKAGTDACLGKKGASHVHVRLVDRPDACRRIVTDLLAEHTEAFAPKGCNRKPKG